MSDFTLNNLKRILEIVATSDEYPQEITMAELRMAIMKVVEKVHPLVTSAFIKSMIEAEIIEINGPIVRVNIGKDDL